ncbi:MAG: exodeoxyribonuclease III [Wenzhouxiangellaceae bacterium]|nr:exodeoxyribonuclease III [Wenzhouxiangellaceae bacterium]
MKIASWNVNSLKVRLDHVLEWLDRHEPDVLGLQETKLTDENFPVEAFSEAGYASVYSGQPTYNGVALLSRVPAEDVVTGVEGFEDPHRRVIAGTFDGVRVINLYVVNGKAVGDEKYHWKLEWLDAVTDWIGAELERHEELAVVGDFNIAPEDRDVHDPEEWHEKILCSTAERGKLERLLSLGLTDSYRLFDQPERVYSWYDYRQLAFRRKRGLRIDLVLLSEKLRERCTASHIDLDPRALERPSDHAPVFAEIER